MKTLQATLTADSPQSMNDEFQEPVGHIREMIAAQQMAQAATGALHNIGNVLNSGNVSVHLISQQLSGSRVSDVRNIARTLNRQPAQLVEFLLHDAEGQQLPERLAELSETLAAEHSRIVEELRTLRSVMNHAQQIIAARQTDAVEVSRKQGVRSSELIEAAVRLTQSNMHVQDVSVSVAQLYDPVIEVDRQLCLQVLVNLLINAAEATASSENSQIELMVDVDPGFVSFRVRDNGSGISPEDSQKLFNYGFTTKETGHGFGLHSCVLATEEMGGTLTAASDGIGLGACFTLRLPVNAK